MGILVGLINLFQFTEFAVLLEFAFLVLIAIFVLVWNKLEKTIARNRERKREYITQIWEAQIKKGQLPDPLFLKKCRTEDLIACILKDIPVENGHDWEVFKDSIFEKHLLPIARKETPSPIWTERLQAVRIFALKADVTDESFLMRLLLDPIPVIKYAAAQSLMRMGSKDGVNRILNMMSLSTRQLRHPFHDALEKGGEKVMQILEQRLQNERDPKVRVSCIEVLASHMNEIRFQLIKQDIHSQNKNMCIAAIRALGSYQSQDSIEALACLLNDHDWEIKALAIRSLGYLKAKNYAHLLEKALKDPMWWVRMNAALALKRLGEQGVNILKAQKKEEDRFAYEIAHYALAFKT